MHTIQTPTNFAFLCTLYRSCMWRGTGPGCFHCPAVDIATSVGRYRIHAVAEMTGVPSATLRAWERRYGIPEPARSGSSYRLYTERDVALVRRLRALCDSGMAIGEAAALVRRDGDPGPETDDPYTETSERIVEATQRFDHPEIERLVGRAVLLGPANHVTDRVFTPALRSIGDLWARGALSVAQEHLATNIIGAALRAMARHAGPGDGARRMLLACFEDDAHDLGLHGVALTLGHWGIDAIVLGARVAPEELGRAVRALSPDAVGLSVAFPPPLDRLGSLLDGYADACGPVPWLVGGHAAGVLGSAVTARGGVLLEGLVGHWRDPIEQAVSRGRARAV